METSQSMDEQFISKVKQTIEINISNENFTVESLANEVGLSRSMLHRKLIKLTGKNASETITQYRLTKAHELLEKNATTVSETAYKVGFRNPSYFNKVFKRIYNISPSDIKRQQHYHTPLNKANNDTEKASFSKIHSLITKKRLIYSLGLIVTFLIFHLIIIYPYKPQPSVAVLPFENLSGNINNDYIVSGINEALISELGKFSSLRVISRKSTLRYSNSRLLLKDIAKELNVKNIIEGSVISIEDSIHLIIKVIRVLPREHQLMSKKYCEHQSKILDIQQKIAADITFYLKNGQTKRDKHSANQAP